MKELVGEVKMFFVATTAHGFQYLVSHESHGPIRYQCFQTFLHHGELGKLS
jgi:hypothetical protein